MRSLILLLIVLFSAVGFAQTRGARNDEDRLSQLFYGNVAPLIKEIYNGNLSELRQQEFRAAEIELGPLFGYIFLPDNETGRASLLRELNKLDPALQQNRMRAVHYFNAHPEMIVEILKNPHASMLLMIDDLEKIQPVRSEYSKQIAAQIKATLHPEIAEAIKSYLSPVVIGLHKNAQRAVQINNGLVSGVYTKFLYRIFSLYQSFRIDGIYRFIERFMYDYTGRDLSEALKQLEYRRQIYSTKQCFNLF